MPDHVHALFQPWPKNQASHEETTFWSFTELMRSLKSFTAREVNRAEGKAGTVWEKETFDRYIRSDSDLVEKFHYILRNPWDAGVAKRNEDYPWVWTPEDETRTSRSSSPQNAATSTLQA
jgi:REP element-mobilizing transposase RayT